MLICIGYAGDRSGDESERQERKEMIVPVHFPDGSIRDVACDLRPVGIGRAASAARFELVPLQCDASWKFERTDNSWRAVPRVNTVSRLKKPVEEWWRSIEQLSDERPTLRQSQRRAIGE